MFSCCLLALVLLIPTGTATENRKEDTLILLHVVVRHGDRMPISSDSYPTDPHKGSKYYPVGSGGLTKSGVQRSYQVGTQLRKRYDEFLGPIYYYDQIEAISSALPRCKGTMQAVLTTLFPENAACKEGQFVDFKYIERGKDRLISTYITCPEIMNPTVVNPAHTCPEKEYLNFFLKQHTGYTNPTLHQVFNIKSTINIQEENGFGIPKWIDPVWPEPMWNCSRDLWRAIADNETSLSYAGGNLIHKIITDTYQKIQSKTPELKTYIYSGHDLNIIALLGILDLYRGEEVKYSEYLMFEVHHIDGVFGFKVYHENYLSDEPVLLDIPNCASFCPIDGLLKLTQKFIPGSWCQF